MLAHALSLPPRMSDSSAPPVGRVTGPGGVALLLGIAQTLAWGSTYYLPAVLIPAVLPEFGADRLWVFGAFSLALLISGFAAPATGHAIERFGGRPVLILSSCVLSLGLARPASRRGLWGWFIGWIVLGFGMALGLYEAAFATLGTLYGRAARKPITLVTLLAGFASTVGWPATAALIPLLGWRNTCLAYVAVNLGLVLPLYLLLPRAGQAPPPAAGQEVAPDPPAPSAAWARHAFLLLAVFFTLRALITGVVAVHFVALFGGLGLGVAAAVAIGALQGPSQVGGRILEFTLGSKTHPLTVAKAGAVLLPLGVLVLLALGPEAAAGFMLAYGASNGILTISKGAVPLALFGPRGYPVLMGRLALPILVAQAIAPTLSAPLVAVLPARLTFAVLGLLAALAFACLLPLRARDSAA